MPEINITDLRSVDLTKVERLAKETAYAAVGFGVLGFQRAQVRRRELAEAVAGRSTTLSQLGEQISAGLHSAGETARPQLGSVTAQLGSVTAQLSEVGEVVGTQTATAREQLVELLKTVDERVAPARKELDARIDELEVRLPASTRTTFQQLRAAAALPAQTLRGAIGLDETPQA